MYQGFLIWRSKLTGSTLNRLRVRTSSMGVAITLVAITCCFSARVHSSDSWLLGGAWGSSSDDSTAWRVSATKPWKKQWFSGGRAHLTGYWEASVALFENDVKSRPLGPTADPRAEQGTAYLWNLALAPVFRLQFTLGENGSAPIQPFLDLGVGVSFMSDREFRTGKERSRPLGSYFQFEDRGAVGVTVGRWEVAYQRMHYSNLNLAADNFGIDAHLLLLRRELKRR